MSEIENPSGDETYRDLFENTPIAYITVGPEGGIQSINRKALELFQCSSNELLGKNILTLYDVESGSQSLFENLVKEFSPERSLGSEAQEMFYVRPNETRFWGLLTFTALYTAGGELLESRSMILDINEQKEAAKELERERSRADKAIKAKSEFLTRMSHEIRTPINAMVGAGDLLSETSLEGAQKTYSDILQRSGEHLLHLLGDILDISRLSSGQAKLESDYFNPQELAREVIELVRSQNSQSRLELRLSMDEQTPSLVWGDKAKLSQALLNLLANGFEFCDEGILELAIRPGLTPDGHGSLHFSVRDEGPGIPESFHVKIFEAFEQVDTSLTRKHNGVGLGLTISKHLIELMGGSIRLESKPGEGSCFSFELVFERPREGTGDDEVNSPQDLVFNEPYLGIDPTPGITILVVEDNPDNGLLIEAFLKDTPYHVIFAENGLVALEKVIENDINIILMDMEMPIMDGYTAVRKIRRLESRRAGKFHYIIALTAHAMKEDIEKCMQSGCDLYLSKPIKKKRLLEVLAKTSEIVGV